MAATTAATRRVKHITLQLAQSGKCAGNTSGSQAGAAATHDDDPQASRGDIVLPSGRLRSQVAIPGNSWELALQLNAKCQVAGGSPRALAAAIGTGADMRVATNFPHSEHIDPTSGFGDMIGEVAGFQVTYAVQREGSAPWVAGVMTQRQPIECPTGFGPRPSMSLFLYNMDGHQAIARPFLDGIAPAGPPSGPETVVENAVAAAADEKQRKQQPRLLGDPGGGCFDPVRSGRVQYLEAWDSHTNAPSQNFIWHFDFFKFFVGGGWVEVLQHDMQGMVLSGSLEVLAAASCVNSDRRVACILHISCS